MTDERQGGAWIGQHPDENTEHVREVAEKQDAERIAVTNNEAGDTPTDDADDWPSGHRQGHPATDDDIRDAGSRG